MKVEERSDSFRRIALWVLISGACYYLATELAWALCLSESKVSLLFPPHAVLVSVLLLVPTRHWWAYTFAAICGHLLAAQQAHWPILFTLQSEAFDMVQNLLVAAGIRIFIKSPFESITLRDTIVFVVVAVIVVPFGTAFWGAALTLSNHYGTDYWIEWRKLGIANGVTAIVLVPAILLGVSSLSTGRAAVAPGQMLEAAALGLGILTVGALVFDKLPAGPGNLPGLLYAPVPFLIWAALRFGLGGMSVSMLVITFEAIWGAMRGHGPFLMQTPAENALSLQSFLLVTATPLMFLAVAAQEERGSQSALRESEVRFSAIANAAPVMIWTSGTDRLCNFFNKGWLEFTGRTLEQELGNGWVEGVHPDDLGRCLETYVGSFDARRPFIMEYRLRRSDGEYRWISDNGVPHFGAGQKFLGYIGSCMDITARKQSDLEIAQQRNELAHVGRLSTMGQLASSLAHELNQPLTAILSNAQAGSRFLAAVPPDLAEVRGALEDAAQDAKRAGEVIRQLRALVRRDEPVMAPLELNRVIVDVVRMLHSDMLIRKVQVSLELDPGLSVVNGDNIQLQQLLLNLVLNAFDAMKDAPEDRRTVILRTRQLDADSIRAEVSDLGTGISPDRLVNLFEPFRSSKRDGLGLGLSISHSIVEAHRGRLWAENNSDRGATFYFTLPVQEPGLNLN
jgi:PAS domain S-box-containing protein